ncbi:MAG: phosphonate ABC transporter, permease protein PhnE [Proteobacteria bacterium]|nr:phosphonate ABC transporter, permease protein PhnE [Pseudomonadota bacterium]
MTTSVSAVAPSTLPGRKRRAALVFFGVNVAFLFAAFTYLKINPLAFLRDLHFVIDLLEEMLPPAFAILLDQALWSSIGETFSMAFLGTLGGAALAFLLAFLAADNTTPVKALKPVTRALLGAQRAAPDFAIMLVIVVAVGFGPFAGTLALLLGSTGMFGKLFADAVENVDQRTLDGLWVTGATRLQVIRYGVVPQVLPSFIANTLYLFEINIGGAIALGVFGGGGLGFAMHIANATLSYAKMLAYILVIVLMMMITERIADTLRHRIFRQSVTQ